MLYLMRRIISTLLAGTWLLAGQTAPAHVSLPQWLIAYPGALAAVTSASSTLVESSYTATAKPEEVSGHYAKLFTSNGLVSQSNYDGLGTVIRVSAPECNLLIKLRESSAGTAVKVQCASPQTSSPRAGLGNEVMVTNGSVNEAPVGGRSRNSGSGYHLKSAEEIKQYNEERTREIKAKQEAYAREVNAQMQEYDKPFYPKQSQAHMPPASNLAPKTAIAYYHDDAPPLVWPSWLVAVNGEHFPPATRSSQGPESALSRKYQTTVAMTELARFYKEGLARNGFTVIRSRMSTGSTSTGVQQNASGEIEAYRGEGSGVNPPTTTIKVSFRRMYLNEPISVWINVSVRGSFGR